MKLLTYSILLTTLSWGAVSGATTSDIQQQNDAKNSQYESTLKTLLNSLHSITKVPGYSVAVVQNGNTLATVSTGYANLNTQTKANENTVFRLASVSKVVGASMLAELVAAGKLDPDLPIGHYMPQLNKQFRAISVRQLLSHTSGMPHYQAKDYDIYDKHYESAVEAISTLKNRRLLSKPGTEYHYSTHGYTLAGALYEQITAKPLSQSLPQFIQRQTGRKTPMLENIHNLPTDVSSLYRFASGKIQPQDFGEKSYSVFGAGMSSTAIDLAHFGYAVLKHSKKNDTYHDLLFSPTLMKNGNAIETGKYQVGFGWRIGSDMQGRKVYYHAGATPGARSILVLYPEYNLTISILSNISWVAEIDQLAFSLASLHLDNARAVSLTTNGTYNARFGESAMAGRLNCYSTSCVLENESTDYTQWLNQFNATDQSFNDWPIYPFTSDRGECLLMVTKTGIRTLSANNDHYQTEFNNGKRYQLQLIFQ